MAMTGPSRPEGDGRTRRRRRALVLAMALFVGAASTGAYTPASVGEAADQVGAAPVQLPPVVGAAQRCHAGAELFQRTELFFGSARPDGSVVTEAQFQQFLDREITPRFPDGLTLLTGLGQFRGANGVIARERSMLLILLYPQEAAGSSSAKIEQIRTAYKRAFQQESVLRADDRLAQCVSF
jgi:hypothetical protein